MILALAVILGVAASFVRYRKQALGRIAAIPLQSAWLVLLAVVLQIPLLRAPSGATDQVRVQQVLFLVSHLLLLVFVYLNRSLPEVLIIGLGVSCNLLVIVANGGFMPITPETLIAINPGSIPSQWPLGYHYGFSKDVVLTRQDTNLWGLSDMLVVPPPFPWPTAFSLGDLIIAVGIVALLVRAPGPATGLVGEEASQS